MNLGTDQLTKKLESELGADAVKEDPNLLATYAVDGKPPTLLCRPKTPEEIATALRLGSELDAAITPWGGGTAMRMGNLPRQVSVVLELSRLNRVIEHDHANLTATVQSGIALTTLQEALAPENQFLPFDPPYPRCSTIGGIVAANLNGPRRIFYGSVRDLVIGMKVVLASGEQVKAGGKVVKNVAGYDMCKLFVGSLGTLGIITEVTLRMAPVPETAETLVASGTLEQLAQLVDELSRSPLLPAAVFLLNGQAWVASDALQGDWRLALWCEGFETGVTRHLRDTLPMAEGAGASTEILRGMAHCQFWDAIRDFPLRSEHSVYRVTVPRASVADVIKIISDWETPDFHPAIVSDTSVGTVWIAFTAHQAAIDGFPKLIRLAREHEGHAIMLAAPPAFKEGIDTWGPTPSTLSLMREIKRQFDPKGLLNPGRFSAGL
jgi:glycolate oxidase FAD binding subunit